MENGNKTTVNAVMRQSFVVMLTAGLYGSIDLGEMVAIHTADIFMA